MSRNYILSLKQVFDQAVEKQAFQDVKDQLSQMNDARLLEEWPTIGSMMIKVDNDAAFKLLENSHKATFNFSPEVLRLI